MEQDSRSRAFALRPSHRRRRIGGRLLLLSHARNFVYSIHLSSLNSSPSKSPHRAIPDQHISGGRFYCITSAVPYHLSPSECSPALRMKLSPSFPSSFTELRSSKQGIALRLLRRYTAEVTRHFSCMKYNTSRPEAVQNQFSPMHSNHSQHLPTTHRRLRMHVPCSSPQIMIRKSPVGPLHKPSQWELNPWFPPP